MAAIYVEVNAGSAVRGAIHGEALESLAAARGGPCYTFLLPNQRPGAPTGNHHRVLRQMVRDARMQADKDEAAVLDAVEALADAPEFLEGGPGLAVFRNQHLLECYSVPEVDQAEWFLGERFLLLPVLKAALAVRECAVLNINRKQMRWFEYRDGECSAKPWPEGVPAGFEEAEAVIRPPAENRSSTGSSPGAMLSVQFASNPRPEREGAGAHLVHFFQLVDAGLMPALKNRPLLLAGVAEEVALYRRVAKYSHLLEVELAGNLSHTSLAALANRTKASLEAELLAEGARTLARAQGNAISDLHHVLQGAKLGKIHRLWVCADTMNWDAGIRKRVNACVAETLFFGGDVFLVRKADLGEGPLLALPRY